MKEIKLTTVTISHENRTASISAQDIVELPDVMELIRGVLLNLGFHNNNIREYIPDP